VALVVAGPWMLSVMLDYMREVFNGIPCWWVTFYQFVTVSDLLKSSSTMQKRCRTEM
jgi:hypothetical protein